MSEFSLISTTKNKTEHLSTLLLSDFMLFCSFILSHPLYFSYFIFFSPYIFKILSFLSPLFVTTTLLILAFVNLSDSVGFHLESPESKVSFLLATYQTLLQTLKSKVGENELFGRLEELEVYKIVFEVLSTSDIEFSETNLQSEEEKTSGDLLTENSSQTQVGSKVVEALTKEKSAEYHAHPETNQVVKLLEEFLQEKEAVENKESKITENYYNYETNGSRSNSMRKEKEWKKTLAGKLFEERHNVDTSASGEEMDLLWETYDQSDMKNKVELKSKSKKWKIKGNTNFDNGDDDDDDDYEENSVGQLCCLQALKFSAGKMNLGMKKPNLMKISKALKGIGWLHHVSSKHGKKGYH